MTHNRHSGKFSRIIRKYQNSKSRQPFREPRFTLQNANIRGRQERDRQPGFTCPESGRDASGEGDFPKPTGRVLPCPLGCSGPFPVKTAYQTAAVICAFNHCHIVKPDRGRVSSGKPDPAERTGCLPFNEIELLRERLGDKETQIDDLRGERDRLLKVIEEQAGSFRQLTAPPKPAAPEPEPQRRVGLFGRLFGKRG
jgi:hypothetical protein